MNLEQLRTQKKELKLTNQEIANIAKLPLRTVEQVMCGRVKNPRIDTVEAIERALGLDEITPEEYECGARKFKRELITADEDELLYLYRMLSEPLKEMLLGVAQTMSGQPGESNLHKKA